MNRKAWLTTAICSVSLLCGDASSRAADDSAVQHFSVGGHKLSLVVHGTSGMPVVVEPGMSSPVVESDEWNAVIDAISPTHRVVLYDRAGLGSSEPTAQASRTSHDIAVELHKLLTAAKVPRPFVLVAHSIGGLNARVYAGLYPNDVAGMVLVDSTSPGRESGWLVALGPRKEGEAQAVAAARNFLQARLDHPTDNPEHMDVAASNTQVRAARTLGKKPLVVLTHSLHWKMIPDVSDAVSEKLEVVSRRLQKQLLTLSTNSTQHIAKTSGHGIPREDPALVVDAIREVMGKIEKPAK